MDVTPDIPEVGSPMGVDARARSPGIDRVSSDAVVGADDSRRFDAGFPAAVDDELLAAVDDELRRAIAPIVSALQLLKLRGDPRSTREH